MFGTVASGKSTQSKRLAAFLGVPHVSIGDLVRDYITAGKEGADAIRSDLAAGRLPENRYLVALLDQRFKAPDARQGLVLDGYPRALSHLDALSDLADAHQLTIAGLILQMIPLDLAIQRATGRWSCGKCGAAQNTNVDSEFRTYVTDTLAKGQPVRHIQAGCEGLMHQRFDDTPDTIRNRHAQFLSLTLPAFEVLAETHPHLIIHAGAALSIDDIAARIERFAADPASASLQMAA